MEWLWKKKIPVSTSALKEFCSQNTMTTIYITIMKTIPIPTFCISSLFSIIFSWTVWDQKACEQIFSKNGVFLKIFFFYGKHLSWSVNFFFFLFFFSFFVESLLNKSHKKSIMIIYTYSFWFYLIVFFF